MICCKVISKKFVIDSRTHKDYSKLGILPHDSFDCQKNEVCINVSFMYFIKNDKGVFIEKLSAMNHTLEENTIGNENYFILWKNVRLHTDLVANLVLLDHLF